MSHPRPAVTGNVIYNYFAHPCSYRVHLDMFGDRDERTAPGPTARYLMERGNRHEVRVFESLKAQHPDDWADCSSPEDTDDREEQLAERIARTLEAMRAGVKYIFHGFIAATDDYCHGVAPIIPPGAPGVRFRGETDILERVDVPSPAFGAHSYVVGDVKSSRHAKFSQKMQVTFYSWILEGLQERLPERGFIVTGAGEREEFAIDETLWTLRHFVEEEVFEFTDPARVFYHLEPRCDGCHWREHCTARAAREDDLSLVPGCRRSEKRSLHLAGITSRSELLARSDENLRDVGRAFGSRLDGFRDLKSRASAQEFARPVLRQHPRTSAPQRRGLPAAPNLFRHSGPYLLLAAATDHYHGDEAVIAALMRRRGDLTGNVASTRPPSFFSVQRPDDGSALLKLLDNLDESNRLLDRRNETMLPVFCDGRLQRRLRSVREDAAVREPALSARIERLLTDAIVLSEVVDRTWFLPTMPWDLDAVAAALGQKDDETFERHHTSSNGGGAELAALADDYGLDREAVRTERDLRPLMIREWRETGRDCWREMLEAELAEDLRCAEWILTRLMKL